MFKGHVRWRSTRQRLEKLIAQKYRRRNLVVHIYRSLRWEEFQGRPGYNSESFQGYSEEKFTECNEPQALQSLYEDSCR